MARRRSLYILPAIVFACSIAGGFYGPHPQMAAAAATDPEELSDEVRGFSKVLTLVQDNYADKVSSERAIFKGAIPGMLRTLDPHSTFLDSREFKAMNEEQKGRYGGVGMQVEPRPEGKTAVKAPFPGSPAYKVGLRPGDLIVAVDGKKAEGLTPVEIADLLKGAPGTEVKITISRAGVTEPMVFTLVREEIQRPSVQEAFWIRPGYAYLKINSFGYTTAREMDDNLRRLGESNIHGLVLDLRGNPGGLLNQGVAVADHFLQKNALIVSHHGRSAPEKAFVAEHGNRGREYPIVVLVNRGSASAAEIVSGALQDHDRALILGETTFGKGLVQQVYPMGEGTGLALTWAHFYTPSGRLIQRDYSGKSFYAYYYQRGEGAGNRVDVKTTESGRTVYGGGGITPDEKYEAEKLDRLQVQVMRTGFFDYTRDYFATHSTRLDKGWMPDDALLGEFKAFLRKAGMAFTDEGFDKHRDWMRRNLAREFYTMAFNVDESDAMYARTDPEVARAMDLMPKASALEEGARKIIVQRLGGRK
jgi:carboxyl-terminal processing protease